MERENTETSPAFRYAITNRLRLKFLQRWLPQMKGVGFNFGAGSSDWSFLVPRAARMWRMDVTACEGKKVDVLMDIQRTAIQTGSLDWALCSEVIEHVPDFKAALGEIHRALKPGAPLILTVPFSVPLHGEPHDYWRFTGHALQALAPEMGFRIVDLKPMGNFQTFFWQTLALDYHRRFAWVPKDLALPKRVILKLIQATVPLFLTLACAMAFLGNSKGNPGGHVLSWGACLEKSG